MIRRLRKRLIRAVRRFIAVQIPRGATLPDDELFFNPWACAR